MKEKDEIKMNIYEKLSLIQSELKVPKSNYNAFGKYKYRSCEDILEAVKPLMLEEKMLLTLADEVVLIGERYYVKATATVMFDKESLSVSAYAREEFEKKGQDGSQITGTASSYARKYALNGLFNIDDTKDADTDEYQKQTKANEKDYNEELKMYATVNGLDLKDLAVKYKLNAKTTSARFKEVLDELKGENK